MKKMLLLFPAVSLLLTAGGDIAPIEPAAPDAADFWGKIGFAYQAQNEEWKGLSFGDTEDNAFSAAVILGVEKALGTGFGFGAEVAGWSDFGLDIADKPRVESGDQTAAEISQAYLTYTFGHTAFKVGRQALPRAVSPWAWTERSAGVIDWVYDGIVVTDTGLGDTTLVGAWIARITHNSDESYRVSDGAGLFMLGAVNKSLPDTTLSFSAYYLPKSLHDINRYGYGPGGTVAVDNGARDLWSLWADGVTRYGGVTFGLQGAYVDGDYSETDATYAIAGKIGSSWGNLDAQLIASYINDGDYSLMLAGTKKEDSALWTENEEHADIIRHYDPLVDVDYSQGQAAILAKFGYRLPVGRLYGSLGYWSYDHARRGDQEESFGARAGYRFDIAGVDTKVEYRYRDQSYRDAPGRIRRRLRVEAYYKF